MVKQTFQRGMILVSFLTCCASLALLLAALSTQHWIVGRAHRTTNFKLSDGRIQFGLFYGLKNLNVGYGWRSYDINVVQLLSEDKNFMSYSLWFNTVLAVALSIFFAAFSAVFALVNTVTTPAGALAGIPGLYGWNCLALLSNLGAVVTWGVQFHLKLRGNVLTVEDRENLWSSDGLAVLGYSFWFVVGAAIIHLLNLALLFFGSRQAAREHSGTLKPIVEKGNGAIMLY